MCSGRSNSSNDHPGQQQPAVQMSESVQLNMRGFDNIEILLVGRDSRSWEIRAVVAGVRTDSTKVMDAVEAHECKSFEAIVDAVDEVGA